MDLVQSRLAMAAAAVVVAAAAVVVIDQSVGRDRIETLYDIFRYV